MSQSDAFSWVERVGKSLGRWRGQGIVVAVSGGSDSVGLLRLLRDRAEELELRLSVAHLDHGVRGEAARADARFVAGLAHALDLPIDLGEWSPSRSGHFESDARRARYDWLARVALDRGAALVAVGHTRDDQAETILQRVIRGTGLRGLAGMPSRRLLAEGVTLIRPLLTVSRHEVRAYLDAMGQSWHVDASNADLSRTRARIRHDLLPKLADEYNPKVADALIRLGWLAGTEYQALGRWLSRLARRASRSGPDGSLLFLARWLRPLPPTLRAELFRMAWRSAGWPEGLMGINRWLRASSLIDRDRGRLDLGGGIVAVREGRWLRIVRPVPTAKPPSATPEPASLPLPGTVDWPGGRIVATLDLEEDCDETIDLDRLAPWASSESGPSLRVRAPVHGDRFQPLGMHGRGMALNDFFRGRRVAWPDRPNVPLVCDRLGIVWVVGHRIADRVRLTGPTQRRLALRWEPDPSGAV